MRTALALAWLTFLGAQPAPPPNAVVLRDGAATLALAGDRAEKNVVSLRYSATLRLTVTVEGGEELAVSAFKADVDDKVWKVVRQTPGDFTGGGDARRWQKEMELDPVKPGKLPVPVVTLRYEKGPGGAPRDVKWSGLEVEVIGPEEGEGKDVRGELPIETLPVEPPWWRPLPRVAAGVAALAVVCFGASLWLRRKSVPAAVPPDQWALRELDALATAEPPAGDAPDWYHTRLSAVVRRYLEERFALRASRQTTQEFLQEARQRPELGEAQQLLRDFLARCDLAKFTGLAPSPAECAEATELARELVRGTAPSGRPVGGGASSPYD